MPSRYYEYRLTIRLDDTDAAGVLYFARLFRHAHLAYEALLDKMRSAFDFRFSQQGQKERPPGLCPRRPC